MDKVKVETYRGINLFYDKDNGCVYFTFEGSERKVNYAFEARRIIDDPVWEECDLKGFFVDGVNDDYIGKAIAKRKDVKSGNPDWEYLGKYSMAYKKSDRGNGKKVYPLTPYNIMVYNAFENQQKIIKQEEWRLQQIISLLSMEEVENIGTMLGDITEEKICGKADLGTMIRIEDTQTLPQERMDG